MRLPLSFSIFFILTILVVLGCQYNETAPAASRKKVMATHACPVFKQSLSRLKAQTSVPVRLPGKNCQHFASPDSPTSINISELGNKHYSLTIGLSPECTGQAFCYLAVFDGTSGTYKVDPSLKKIKLAKGITGYASLQTKGDGTPVNGLGTTGYGPYITWQQGNAFYTVGMKDDLKYVIQLANDSILSQPL